MSEASRIPLRTWRDRLRQVALFEVIGLLLVTPIFSYFSGRALMDSAALMVLLSLLAAIWNAVYGVSIDWVQARWFGVRADQRSVSARALHAVCFEGGLLLLTLPVIALWTGMRWWDALLADLGLTLAYAVYAFVFNLAYDRHFPIMAPLECSDAKASD